MDRNLIDSPQDNILILDIILYSNPSSKNERIAYKTKVYGLI
jgi:hypothetical protein